jgi:hypothetical protein
MASFLSVVVSGSGGLESDDLKSKVVTLFQQQTPILLAIDYDIIEVKFLNERDNNPKFIEILCTEAPNEGERKRRQLLLAKVRETRRRGSFVKIYLLSTMRSSFSVIG